MERGERRLEENLTRTLAEKKSDQQLHAEGLEVVCMYGALLLQIFALLYKAEGAKGIHAIGVKAKP